MTLLNTISNIGVNYPATLALYLIDLFSTKQCAFDLKSSNESILMTTSRKKNFLNFLKSIHLNTCSTDQESHVCSFFFYSNIEYNF